MIEMIVAIAYTVVAAMVFALWEIQIEGKNGWAKNLPCWKIQKNWVVKLMGGRPLTGYHLYMIVFLILIIHFPFFFTEWEVKKELFLFSFFFGFLLLEDFFWFVLNPHYGLRRFKKTQIEWHKNWWGPVPDFYWWYSAIAAISLYIAIFLL
jgi:hypothetical protein